MTAILLSLELHDQVIQTNREGDRIVSEEVVSETLVRARMRLSPDDLPTAQTIGFVDMLIECKPDHMPDMNKADTVKWLLDRVKLML